MTNKVQGVAVNKVNKEHFYSVLKKHGIEVASIPDAIKAYHEQVVAPLDKKKVLQCENCGGYSPFDLDACPYCGESDADNPAVKEKVLDAVPEPTNESKPAKGKKNKPKPTTGEVAEDASVDAHDVAKALVKQEKTKQLVTATVEELDSSVEKITAAKSEAANSYWKLGCLIGENHSKQLWRARVGEDGNQKYSSFEQFCGEELGMSGVHARKLMDISKAFSEHDVAKFGTAKLGLVLQVPESEQPKLLEAAKSASKREIEKQVKETKAKLKSEGKKTSRETGRKDNSKAVEKAQEAKKEKEAKKTVDTITVATITGNKTVKLFATPEKKGDAPKPAKKLTDNPWGQLELANGVMMVFKVKENAAGELILNVVTKRED